MLTLFASPKSFTGHVEIIQRNAIRSWILLHPRPEIILFGNDPGTAEIAAEFGLRHFPDVKCSELGTPLISDIFEKAAELATHDLLCYINSDIILMSDFPDAIETLRSIGGDFLMIGRRWNLDITQPIDFSAGWDKKLRDEISDKGILHPPSGIDYFVLPRRVKIEMPPFAIGRPGWDNWLLYKFLSLRIPVIDATRTVTIVHQNHDYRHVPRGSGNRWDGPEADRNREIAGFVGMFSISDSTHQLHAGRVRKSRSFSYFIRRIDAFAHLHPEARTFAAVGRFFRRTSLVQFLLKRFKTS